jgi:hypothetical protein
MSEVRAPPGMAHRPPRMPPPKCPSPDRRLTTTGPRSQDQIGADRYPVNGGSWKATEAERQPRRGIIRKHSSQQSRRRRTITRGGLLASPGANVVGHLHRMPPTETCGLPAATKGEHGLQDSLGSRRLPAVLANVLFSASWKSPLRPPPKLRSPPIATDWPCDTITRCRVFPTLGHFGRWGCRNMLRAFALRPSPKEVS